MRRELTIRPGLQADDTPNAVGTGGLTVSSNMRSWRGQSQTIGGWESLTTDQLDGKCRGVHTWTDNEGEICIAFGTNTNLYIWRGGALHDITPASGFTPGNADGLGGRGWGTGAYGAGFYGLPSDEVFFPLTWSLDNYGENLIACPRGQTIFQLDHAAFLADFNTNAVAITGAPASVQVIVVTRGRQLVAYGCNEEVSGDINPRAIRWTDTEDLTDWTTATDSLAGEYVLEDDGRLVGAIKLGNTVLVLTDSGAILQQQSVDPLVVFTFDHLSKSCGLVGPNGVTAASQTAYWLSDAGVFWRYSLGGSPERLITPIAASLNGEIAATQRDKVYAATCAQFEEVHFHYPSAEAGENDGYVGYNTRTNEWYRGNLARTAAIDAAPTDYPVGVDPDGRIFWQELGQSANGGSIAWEGTTGYIRLPGGERSMTVRQLFPDIHNQVGPVKFIMRSRERINGPDTGVIVKTIQPDTQQVDFFLTGRYVSLTYCGQAGPTFARLGTHTLDIVQRGRR